MSNNYNTILNQFISAIPDNVLTQQDPVRNIIAQIPTDDTERDTAKITKLLKDNYRTLTSALSEHLNESQIKQLAALAGRGAWDEIADFFPDDLGPRYKEAGKDTAHFFSQLVPKAVEMFQESPVQTTMLTVTLLGAGAWAVDAIKNPGVTKIIAAALAVGAAVWLTRSAAENSTQRVHEYSAPPEPPHTPLPDRGPSHSLP